MNEKTLSTIASRLLRIPAAPYHETAVRAEVEKICGEHGLNCQRDTYGNVLVRLQTVSRQRPFVLAAHLDHPGFEIIRPLAGKRWLARFLGGVGDTYFKKGIPIRLMPGGVPAKLGKRVGKEKQFEIHALKNPSEPPRFAVWELEDFALRGGKIHARACDDLVGVAAILATMISLQKTRARVNVIGVISRAEEIGFQGALTVADSRLLPKDSLVISLETSRELPPAVMGKGVILRVGDRTSIFDSTAMRFLAEVAGDLNRRDKSFQFQRALMYGGTCEATAYQEFGFQTGAVCVALGNYHNCAPNNKIAAEYVSLADACSMVDLLVAAAKQMKNFRRLTARLPVRLKKLLKQARRKL
ncbi:MAG TPA: M20/M25/M40 family metallo-hydrolase [Verrucomicrobiae bacterium]|nr:M20/M25/M40 family metallo-hydrolase [Verrucomicrobiae bacterium]